MSVPVFNVDEGAMTPGLKRAITRHGHFATCECGFLIPAYVGRYPKTCPLCGKPIERAAPPQAPASDADPHDDATAGA